jgi:8-oxo-dGTP pyrophosphatase MutT (NUDIX family)
MSEPIHVTERRETRSEQPAGGPAETHYPRRTATEELNRFLIPSSELPPGFLERLDAPPGSVAAPRPAATVVLVRDGEHGPEVLLLRRTRRSGFAADAWVFPGGVLDPGDADPALAVLCDGPTPDEWAVRLGLSDSSEAFGYAVAALREAFEETGILLARPTAMAGPPSRIPLGAESAARYREGVLAGRVSLREMAAAEGLQLALDQLTYIAHWITPEPEPRRYDTRFFLSQVTAEADALLHEEELVEARWLRPREAVEGFRSGELTMLPPTVHTLRRIGSFATVGSMRSALEKEPVPAILPRMRRDPEGVAIEIPPVQS